MTIDQMLFLEKTKLLRGIIHIKYNWLFSGSSGFLINLTIGPQEPFGRFIHYFNYLIIYIMYKPSKLWLWHINMHIFPDIYFKKTEGKCSILGNLILVASTDASGVFISSGDSESLMCKLYKVNDKICFFCFRNSIPIKFHELKFIMLKDV